MVVDNCHFIDNTVQKYGAGMYFAAQSGVNLITLANCLFNYDRALNSSTSDGGGIWVSGTANTTFTMTGCTVVHCSVAQATGAGGGLAFYGIGSLTNKITNCIFFDNVAGPGQDILDAVGLAVSYCAMQEAPTGAGTYTNNTVFSSTIVPNFVDNSHNDPPSDPPTLNDYHLLCDSACINTADPNASLSPSQGGFPEDTSNVDEDSSTSEKIPDLDLADRIIGSPNFRLDMGCYETQITSLCSTPEYADAAPLPCTDGQVNIDDLLLVITSWGDCDETASFCPGDIYIDSEHAVNIDDLLAVITNWSDHCTSGSYNAGSLDSVEDCMDAASEVYEPYSTEWDDSVNRCVQALCAAEIIECD